MQFPREIGRSESVYPPPTRDLLLAIKRTWQLDRIHGLPAVAAPAFPSASKGNECWWGTRDLSTVCLWDSNTIAQSGSRRGRPELQPARTGRPLGMLRGTSEEPNLALRRQQTRISSEPSSSNSRNECRRKHQPY
jgi:hypothetical protein